MPELDYDLCRQFLNEQLKLRPLGMDLGDFIKHQCHLGGLAEFVDRLVADFVPRPEPLILPSLSPQPSALGPSQPEPFILYYLGDTARAGGHLSPECHVIHAGWDGRVEIETNLSETLDQATWEPSPKLVRLVSGSWLFHQTIPLTRNWNPCPPGTYLVRFTCHFRDSNRHPDSSWHGWCSFQVTGEETRELVISSEGNSLTNLSAVDLASMLRRFSSIRLESNDNALINLQSFESALKDDAAIKVGTGTATMTTIKLIEVVQPDQGHAVSPFARKCTEGRFDLPNDRRILVYAKNTVMLGRNRPKSQDAHTDIALRLYPRTEARDALTRFISRQHLEVSVTGGNIVLSDPRTPSSQQDVQAHANRHLFAERRSFLHSSHAIHYTTTFGASLYAGDQPPQLGLRILSFQEPPLRVQRIQNSLKSAITHLDFGEMWLRDEAGLDALLIERDGGSDELNGKEAYLLVLGIVLVGSNHDCPFRIDHPSIRPHHAILCHWDGQFRILPIEDAPVTCHGQLLHRGRIGTLPAGCLLKLGDVELRFDEAVQFGLEG